jgi:hypothetical protein
VINYLEHDQWGITTVMCMKCGLVVAKREQTPSGVMVLVHMSHSKRYRVDIQDGSFAELIVCAECLLTIDDADMPDLEAAMRWGWQRDMEWKFGESAKPQDRASLEIVKNKLKSKKDDDHKKVAKDLLNITTVNKGFSKRG